MHRFRMIVAGGSLRSSYAAVAAKEVNDERMMKKKKSGPFLGEAALFLHFFFPRRQCHAGG